MKFLEAIKALEEGKKIRCKSWGNGVWVSKNLDWEGQTDTFLIRCSKEEWELYEEPPKMLSFPEVLEGLKKGKKFRRKCWNEINYIYAHGVVQIMRIKWTTANIFLEDFEAKDWIEVK